eukprot:SAG31_NODE_4625_length_3087_cov_8.343039_4_plen_50_part_00
MDENGNNTNEMIEQLSNENQPQPEISSEVIEQDNKDNEDLDTQLEKPKK